MSASVMPWRLKRWVCVYQSCWLVLINWAIKLWFMRRNNSPSSQWAAKGGWRCATMRGVWVMANVFVFFSPFLFRWTIFYTISGANDGSRWYVFVLGNVLSVMAWWNAASRSNVVALVSVIGGRFPTKLLRDTRCWKSGGSYHSSVRRCPLINLYGEEKHLQMD